MSERPNIVFIMSDDQGAWAMHCAGNDDIKTPNLDRLAKEGVRFDNFFCASPVCSPARASVLTGEMPSCHGVHDWLCGGNADTAKFPNMKEHEHFQHPDRAIEYLEGHDTYVRHLAQAGYRCGLSGKWHLGNSVKPKEGFEKWFALFGGGCRYYHGDMVEDGAFTYRHAYITDVITERAIDYIGELSDGDEPFYLSVHFTAPHSPWTPLDHPKEYRELYKDCAFSATPNEPIHPRQVHSCPVGDTPEARRENLTGYYAAISAMDAGIGRLLDELDLLGLRENTVVIFTSDNGMNMGHHGIWGKGNGTFPPNMFDTSVKVPFILSAPFLKESGTINHRMTSHCDLFPTLLDIAGAKNAPGKKQPGHSFYSTLTGGEEQDTEDIVICDEYGAVRMLRTAEHKLVTRAAMGPEEFYDLTVDPDERENKIGDAQYAAVIARMRDKLESWFSAYSLERMDGRRFPVTGHGQRARCNDVDAFRQGVTLYHDDKKDGTAPAR